MLHTRTFCTSTDSHLLPKLSPPLFYPKPKFLFSTFLPTPTHSVYLILTSTPPPQPQLHISSWRILSAAPDNGATPSMSDIEMIPNSQGIFSAKPKKVVVLWDLDNKPPRGAPYQAAMALKSVAKRFGDTVEISAYANRHAFVHLPQWVLEQRRERRTLNILERKGVVTSSEPYVCGVCGRKCKTNLDLKKHFKQLHERERQKKLNRMRSLKGKKKQKYKERFVSGNVKYQEQARELITPKVGYGLASELRRAGVFVKTVEDKPQAADWAVKRQMQHSMTRGVDWLFLVSDDSDFSDMLRRARGADLKTVVVGDSDRALGRHADLWVPWRGVEYGEIGEDELMMGSRSRREEDMGWNEDDGIFSVSDFDEDNELDQVLEEIVGSKSGLRGDRISAFSEEEEGERVRDEIHNKHGYGHVGKVGGSLDEKDLLWDSEDEEDEFL